MTSAGRGVGRFWVAMACGLAFGAGAFVLAQVAWIGLPRPQALEELAYYPSGVHLRPATLGHADAAADLAWLRAVQYYGEHRASDNRFERMEHVFDILTTLAPGFVPANFTLARMRLKAGKPDEAVPYLKAVLRTNPSHVESHALLAAYYDRRGDREQAVQHLEALLRLNPNIPGLKLRLANLYGETGRTAEGMAKAREVVAAEPTSAPALVTLGRFQLERGDSVEAIDTFTKAVKLSPASAGAHFFLAMAHNQHGDLDKAADEFRKAIAIAPNNAPAYNNLAWVLTERKGNLDEALNMARQANEKRPNFAPFLDTLGWIEYVRGNYKDAEPPLAQAAKLAPSNGMIQYHLGMVYYKLGKKDDAIAAFRAVQRQDPKLGDTKKVKDLLKELEG